MATRASKSTAVVAWEEQLKNRAGKALANVAKVGSGGQFFSLKAGVLSLNGNPLAGNKVKGVILCNMLENNYFEEDYNPEVQMSPVCFAFQDVNDPDAPMKPHPDSEKPQHSDCATCEWNKFKSAEKGKGKACKNTARIAIIHEDSLKSVALIKEAPVAFMKLPVTSVGNMAGYVKQVGEVLKRPPESVVTEIAVKPDAKTQFKVSFQLIDDKLPRDTVAALFDKADATAPTIAVPYPPNAEREEAPKPARRNTGTKAKLKSARR